METYTVIATKYGHNVKFSSDDNIFVRLSIPKYSCMLKLESKKGYFEFKNNLLYGFGWADADVKVLIDYIRSPSKWEGVIELDKLKLIGEVNRLNSVVNSSICSIEGHSYKYSPELKILFCKKCANILAI